MFDTSEVIEEKPDKTEEEDKGSKQGNIGWVKKYYRFGLVYGV